MQVLILLYSQIIDLINDIMFKAIYSCNIFESSIISEAIVGPILLLRAGYNNLMNLFYMLV